MIAESARLVLRAPTLEDETAWRALRDESSGHLLPWEPAPLPGSDPSSSAAFASFAEGSRSERHLKTLAFRREDRALVGQFSLNEIVRGPFCSAYLGYWVGSPFVRQGFAREAIDTLVALAFDELGLHRVEANVQPTNTASLAVVRRLGFRREGFSPRYLKIAVWIRPQNCRINFCQSRMKPYINTAPVGNTLIRERLSLPGWTRNWPLSRHVRLQQVYPTWHRNNQPTISPVLMNSARD